MFKSKNWFQKRSSKATNGDAALIVALGMLTFKVVGVAVESVISASKKVSLPSFGKKKADETIA